MHWRNDSRYTRVETKCGTAHGSAANSMRGTGDHMYERVRVRGCEFRGMRQMARCGVSLRAARCVDELACDRDAEGVVYEGRW